MVAAVAVAVPTVSVPAPLWTTVEPDPVTVTVPLALAAVPTEMFPAKLTSDPDCTLMVPLVPAELPGTTTLPVNDANALLVRVIAAVALLAPIVPPVVDKLE